MYNTMQERNVHCLSQNVFMVKSRFRIHTGVGIFLILAVITALITLI